MNTQKPEKEFFLFRIFKKIFFAGLANILPALLVISILVIAYNFLENRIGAPVNKLIKKQLASGWKNFAVTYMNIDPELYEPLKTETYEDVVRRVQHSSVPFFNANTNFENARKKFEKQATPFIQKKESSSDPEYIQYLETKIENIRETTGLITAEKKLEVENVRLRREISRENEIRLTKAKLKDSRPDRLKNEINSKYPAYVGLLIALFLIFITGMIFTTVAGRSLSRFWEKTMTALPLVKNLYPYTKQLTEFLFSEKKKPEFTSVALIEYPRKGIFALGFPTGEVNLSILNGTHKKITIFIPSSPTPFTGYTIFINEDEVIPVNITVEEAIRLCITGGVVKPSNMLPVPEENKKV